MSPGRLFDRASVPSSKSPVRKSKGYVSGQGRAKRAACPVVDDAPLAGTVTAKDGEVRFAGDKPGAEDVGYVASATAFEKLCGWISEVEVDRLDERPEAENIRLGLQGPPTGNTGASILHRGGLDWLELTLYGSGLGNRWLVAQQVLKRAKDEAVFAKMQKWVTTLEGEQMLVWATGMGKGYCHMPLVVEWQGIQVSLGARTSSLETQGAAKPMAFVQITGKTFLAHGEVRVIRNLAKLLRLLGIRVQHERIRRVDGCVDMPNVDVSEFVGALERRQWVSRGRKHAIHYVNGKLTGCTVHGESVSLRVYDKLAESADDPLTREAMRVHRWGGVIPESATRVEFQLRPGKAEWAEIGSLQDLLPALHAIFMRASLQWFRLIERVGTEKHTERMPLLPLWEQVVESFAVWTAVGQEYPAERVPGPAEVPALAKSMLGTMACVFDLTGMDPEETDSLENMILRACGLNGVDNPAEEIKRRMQERRVGRATHDGG